MTKTSIILPEDIQGSVSYSGAIYNDKKTNNYISCDQLSSIICKLKILE
jgi:hypothetical protein